uniref:Chondroitin sulfate proteoglycan 4-like n=1 Tax=Dermatophagoides pteronyssinus TaxID=6956 RepID=A0A6P6XRP2_DERPT|nr:chondroitin sulfate proteoglycan 4-like [Dermatophagoides pteronyssinus]
MNHNRWSLIYDHHNHHHHHHRHQYYLHIGFSLLKLWLIFASFTLVVIDSASFYGQSYLKIPSFPLNNNQTKIQLEFRTHQSDAFIFLAAGSSDYCLLYLERGQLAVKINFGLGETFLKSNDDDYYDSKPLNDLEWHHVHLERIDRKLLLKIDSTRIYSKQIQGFHRENGLKIQYGIYLGSSHGLKSLYLGDIHPLRGCLDYVYFNEQNLFNLFIVNGQQQQQQRQVINHEVDLDQKCDEQFSPSNIIINNDDDSDNKNETQVTISFVHHQNSYVLLPGLFGNSVTDSKVQPSRTTNLSVQFDLKTTSTNAMILFISGTNTYRKEFFAIEIIRKRLKVSINDGNDECKLHSNIILADSQWHHVEILLIDNGQLMATIDGQRESSSTTKTTTWQLFRSKLSNELYLGGLIVERQSLAVNLGLESTLITSNVSLKGCIRNFRINSHWINIIRDAIVTRKILAGNNCQWEFLCHDDDDPDKRPCIDRAKCSHEQFDLIKCSCQNHHNHHYRHWPTNQQKSSTTSNNLPPPSSCVRKNFKHKSIIIESINDNDQQDSDRIQPLNSMLCDKNSGEISVNEGTITEINSALLTILTDANILSPSSDNDRIFDVVIAKKPDYGSINLDQLTIDSNVLRTQPIRYTHIISGKMRDSMSLELVRRQSKTFDIVECDRYLIRILFKIVSTTAQQQQNDVAVNDLVHRIHLKILANNRFPLTSSMFKLKDILVKGKNKKKDDHHPQFKIIDCNPNDHGYFAQQNKNFPIKIENFTENAVRNGSIFFVHEEKNVSLSSTSVKCMISHREKERFELTFKPYNLADNELINTGLLMAHHTHALITTSNLSLITNDILEQQDKNLGQLIRYEIDEEPKFGVVQKLRSLPNNWMNVTQFTQRQLDRGKIRYLHIAVDDLLHLPESDRIDIQIMFQKQLIRRIRFAINFVSHLELESYGTNIYNFSRNEKEFIITSTELSYQTQPILSDPESIRYRLRSVPSYGTLYSLATTDVWQRKLRFDSQFSQNDLNERKIFYVRNNSFVNIDSLRDLIDSFSYDVNVSNLTVLEGDRSVIDENHLYLRSTESSSSAKNDVQFDIIKQPMFGRIEIENADNTVEINPSRISQRLIQQRKVYYVHDDSENNIDFFDFFIENFTNNGRINAKFSIEILMKNDNPPQRKCLQRLNIIRNTERLLTNRDICYVDLDLNTWPSNILFTKIYSTIGSFHFLNNSMAQSFTQQDLNDGQLKFRHNGNLDSGKAIFSITDGHFNLLAESLEIRASDPYIEIINNTGAVVKYGDTCLITSQNLSIETNLPDMNEIFIKLLTEPHYGQILINEKSTNHFTLQELQDGLVEYESTVFEDETIPFSRNDSFEFRVFSNDHDYKDLVTKSQEFIIRIYPQNYFHLDIINKQNITMLEDSQVLIDSKTLSVKHSELSEDRIVYTVVQPPKSGVIKKLTKFKEPIQNEQMAIVFTQQDIIDGQIFYQNIQSKYSGNYTANESEIFNDRFHDSFSLEAGDDIFRMAHFTLHIELIPKFITLRTENLTVSEGNSIILTRTIINITHPYYMRYVDEFVVIEEPKYGTISSIGIDNVRLSIKSFTGEQLDSGRIYYQHDSSEYESDWFTLVARANSIEKESLPATIHIQVTSINDEAPVLQTIKPINGQLQQKIPITNQSLLAIDADSKANEIVYLISMPINGYLIDIDTNRTIDKFTQADLDMGRIFFIHVGSANGSFRFHLTDGKNYGSSNVFRILVRTRQQIMIDTNQKMLITPGSQQSITNRHLQVSSSDPDVDNDVEREFIYRIIKAPTYGRIILEGFRQDEEEINNFTQQQINENLVLYDQNVPIIEPIVLDRIIFNIESSEMPPLKSVHFIIEIAMENMRDIMKSNVDALIPIKSLTVVEGKFKALSFEELNLNEFVGRLKYDENRVLLKIIRQPLHGIILRNGLILDNFALFPIAAIRNQSIIYMHDDSNSYTDSVIFAIFTNDNFIMSFMNLTLPIKIIPVNDEYPIVVNRSPRMIVKIGSKTLITRSILHTRDNDGNDTNIIYILAGNNVWQKDGFFTHRNYIQEVAIRMFTQQDINDEQIEFVHRGSLPAQLIYWFRVKDEIGIECPMIEPPAEINYQYLQSSSLQNMNEEHCTPYYPLTITVIQFVIELVNKTDIHLKQCSRKAPITRSNLAVKIDDDETDLDPKQIVYQVKKGPFFGHLLVENKRSLHFNQQQINDNQVFYIQENMFNDGGEDSFVVDIFQRNNEKIHSNINIPIIVAALVKARKPFVAAFPGLKSLINIDHVDASELSSETKSNPTFKIIEQPRYGSLSLLSFGQSSSHDIVHEFTQDDIIKNRIVYEAFANVEIIYPMNEIITDRIRYELRALNVQTAQGVLVINIFNNHSDSDHSNDLMNQFLMKNNYLSYLGMTTMFKEQFFLLLFFFILFLVLLIPVLMIIIRSLCFRWP